MNACSPLPRGFFIVMLLCGGVARADDPVVVNDPPGTEYADQWSGPTTKPAPGTVSTADWDVSICRGTFSTLIQNTTSVQFGAYWQCTSQKNATIRAVIQECLRLGANDYYCDENTERYGPLANDYGYMIRSDAYMSCTRYSTGTYYRPVAEDMSVQGVPVTDKTGNPGYSNCN